MSCRGSLGCGLAARTTPPSTSTRRRAGCGPGCLWAKPCFQFVGTPNDHPSAHYLGSRRGAGGFTLEDARFWVSFLCLSISQAERFVWGNCFTPKDHAFKGGIFVEPWVWDFFFDLQFATCGAVKEWLKAWCGLVVRQRIWAAEALKKPVKCAPTIRVISFRKTAMLLLAR